MFELEDRVERLETAIFALDDAISALRDLGKHSEADAECLADIQREYQTERDEINARLDKQEHAERAALEREYYRGLL